MASPQWVSCHQTLTSLKSAFIVERDDVTSYTPADHALALGFVAISSAHVESYVEMRCSDVAQRGVARFLANQPTRAGKALLVWYGTRKKERWPIPLKASELVPDRARVEESLNAYLSKIRGTHGMSGQDVRDLVIPLGVREADLDELLFEKMDAYAWERQRAVHVRVNRAKTMKEPIEEWDEVTEIMNGLAVLDDALQAALDQN